MFCSKCGMANADTGQFCSKCGAPLPGAKAPVSSAGPLPGALPAPHAVHYDTYTGATETSGKAIGSLVCGIFGFIFPAAVAAVILGHWSLSDIRKAAGRLKGHGMATAGLVLGYIGVALVPLIVLIVLAIAIPNVIRARMAANEAVAVTSLRTMNTALMTYGSEYENGFPSNLSTLISGDPAAGNCNHAALLDPTYGMHDKSGYVFYYAPTYPDGQIKPKISPKASAANCTAGGASGYQITADPRQPGKTGARHFYTDQTGVIRYSTGDEPASADSEPID
jgi:type IV pilus assembly protein PilA